MAVGTRYLAIFPVDDQFGTLAPADFAATFNGLLFGIEVPRDPFRPAPLHIPTAFGVGYHMMRLSRHGFSFPLNSSIISEVSWHIHPADYFSFRMCPLLQP
jgi:hypothetical protein